MRNFDGVEGEHGAHNSKARARATALWLVKHLSSHPSQRRDGWGTRRFVWWMRTGNDKRANAGELPSPSTSSGQNEIPCVLDVSAGLRARVCSRVPWRED